MSSESREAQGARGTPPLVVFRLSTSEAMVKPLGDISLPVGVSPVVSRHLDNINRKYCGPPVSSCHLSGNGSKEEDQ